jgi:hypothetical protein
VIIAKRDFLFDLKERREEGVEGGEEVSGDGERK